MIDAQSHVSERAAELRRAFDRNFTEAQHFETATAEDFLSIHVGGDPYALRLGDVAGLYSDKRVTGLPSRVAELRGIAGFRGTMLPVYDLAALLRYPLASSPRWMVVSSEAKVAFAFDGFDGHFRFTRPSVAEHDGPDQREHVREVVRTDSLIRPIVHLSSIVAAIRKQNSGAGLKEEN